MKGTQLNMYNTFLVLTFISKITFSASVDFQYMTLILPKRQFQTHEDTQAFICCVVLHRSLKMEEFIPTTFRMDVREEREAFFAQQEGKMPKHLIYINL